jgi:hypothetical protein
MLIKLYFGLSDRNGNILSDNLWRYLRDEVIAQRFDGFTVYNATGFWKGKREQCNIVEVGVDFIDEGHKSRVNVHIRAIAQEWCRIANQECVLVVRQEVESEFIS